MVELKGSLGGIGLLSVVQLIGEVHHTGDLHLRKAQQRGTLAFDAGHLVAAECGEHHGLQGLANCVLELADADFAFVEGVPSLERTLDIGAADLKKLIERITSGAFQELATSANGNAVMPETTCGFLGFADDRAIHYSRPTALHRCYAGGSPALVNATEQRELCLSGRFATCPRFRTAARAQPAGAPREQSKVPEIPPGVAARLAAASQMHVVGEPAPAPPRTDATAPAPRRSRRLVVVIGAAVLGFVLVGATVLLVVPALHLGQPGPSNAPAARPTSAPPAPVTAPVAAAGARATAPSAPATASVRAPTVTPLPLPTPVPTVGRPLMDLRFAAGPGEKWVDNPPYAAWSDGAYRFQAHDATRFVAVGVPIDQVMSDVIVSATFRKTGGPPGGGYGLIVRDQGPEPRDGVNQQMTAYVLETGDLGEYGIWRRDGDRWIDLVPWMRSPNIRSGGSPNDLVVRATGDELTFSVNGADVATIHDDVLDAGGVGLFVGGDDNEVALDHFSVHVPD